MNRSLDVNVIGIRGSFWTAFGIFLLVSFVSGCASFREVKVFAALSSDAASYDALPRDYVAALDRRKQYQPEKFHGELEAQKIRREAQRASLDLLQQTVTDYMQGLGNLAAGNAHAYDKSLKELSTNLSRATLLTSEEKEAVGALSTLLARAATAGYRLHELRKLVRDANQPLQHVIQATRKIVEKGMIADLQVETALLGRYYDNFMYMPGNPMEPVAMALAREAKAESLGRVNTRIRSAQGYIAVLDKIANAHQYLYEHHKKIGSNELDKQFKPYVADLRMAYRGLLDVSH
ncbi:hypothetical protein [Nitrosospira multiformis]|uniref:DUF3829 domain-containing protein n=1 Tax=Nitrosospira multiformis TaxID=1231 RepID=A0A1I7HVB3_9PROT|nr:hypothetical protein [Nitrosospira multiformis]SFU64610.1 hypothetical protein SAMN05216417_11216 [Nitrosospira multiformis]